MFDPVTGEYAWKNTEYGTVSFALLGDLDKDGTAGLKDISYLFRWWNGSSELTADETVADVNKDMLVDLRDAAALFHKISA